MRKRLLSALLAMAMVLTMLPMSAFAADQQQPNGLADYKVIAAGVANELPEGFPTENAGNAATAKNVERVYVQLNKPVPEGYTVTLTVYPANEAKGAYLSTFINARKDNAWVTPSAICITTERMAQWYWGDQKPVATTLKDAFGTVENLYFHVGIAKADETTGAPVDVASATDENGKVVFNPKNSVSTTAGAETGDAPTLIEIDPAKPYEAPATPTEYTIKKAAATNGAVTVSAEKAAAGTEVTITATPNAGYEVDKITVVDADDTAVTVTEGKFTMPAKNVTVTVTFKQTTAPGAVVPKFTAATNANEFAGKKAEDIQSGNIEITKTGEKYVVTGATLKEITEPWTEFNKTLTSEQTGYYLAIAVPKTIDEQEIKGMILPGKDAEGKPTTKEYTGQALTSAFTDDDGANCNVFIWMGAEAADVKAKTFTIQVKYGDATKYTPCEFDFSNVKVEGEAATKIIAVEITMPVADVNLNGAMPTATVTTTPVNGADIAVVWKNAAGETVTAENAVKTAGTYTANFIVTAKPGFELADNVTYKLNDGAAATIKPTATVKVVAPTPKMFAGLSMDAEEAVKDIKAATGLTANFDGEDAENLLWFVMTGLEQGEYTMSMKNSANVEVLNDNSVSYETPGKTITVGASGKYLLYVSLDEFSANGATGQGNKTALGNGGKFTVTATKGDKVVTGEINLVTVTLKAEEVTTPYTPVVMYAQQNGKVAIPAGVATPERAGYTFQGWTDGTKTYAAGAPVTVATANVTLNALWKNDLVEKAPAESTVTGITDNTVKTELQTPGALAADAAPMLSDPAAVQAANTLADTVATKKDAYLAEANTGLADGEEEYDNVKVIVYMQIDVTGYQAPEAGEQPKEASLKLNVTPKVAVVATRKNAQGEEETKIVSSTAKTVDDTAKPVEIAVKLPTGFPTDNLFAKHYESDGKTVKEWLTVTVTAGVAKFTAPSFSPFELVQNADSVDVLYKATAEETLTYTAADINKTALKVLENDSEKGTFKGWALTADATTAKYTGTLTEKMLKDMITDKGAETKLVLYPVFVKSSSGTNPGGPIGGGASGTTTYSVNVPTTANGTVTVNPRNAAKDATVTITVAPNQGYHLDTLTVTDKDGNTVELTKVDSNKYTFKMPASRVEIKATFVEGEAPAISFTDVVEGEYYVDAVKWAVDKGITNGLTDTTFGPNASCTRAQMVTFLWRAAGSPEPTTTTTAFTDVDSNEYYYKAMLWAVEKGITKGTTDTTFAPNATVTRAQTVTFLYRYAGSPAVSGTNAFTDLEAGEYYVDAVQWAATNGITTGTTETTFSPANNCTRGQIVTFLYRHIVK